MNIFNINLNDVFRGFFRLVIRKPHIEVIAQQRYAECVICQHRKRRACELCGCYLKAKIRCVSDTNDCPLGKWSDYNGNARNLLSAAELVFNRNKERLEKDYKSIDTIVAVLEDNLRNEFVSYESVVDVSMMMFNANNDTSDRKQLNNGHRLLISVIESKRDIINYKKILKC